MPRLPSCPAGEPGRRRGPDASAVPLRSNRSHRLVLSGSAVDGLADGAGALALSIGLVWLVTPPARVPKGRAPFWPALREGFGWLLRGPAILRPAVMVGAVNMVTGGGTATLPEPKVGRAAAPHAPFLAGAAICGALVVHGAPKLRFR